MAPKLTPAPPLPTVIELAVIFLSPPAPHSAPVRIIERALLASSMLLIFTSPEDTRSRVPTSTCRSSPAAVPAVPLPRDNCSVLSVVIKEVPPATLALLVLICMPVGAVMSPAIVTAPPDTTRILWPKV